MAILTNNKLPYMIDILLARAVQLGASDLHLQAEQVPMIRLQGAMIQLGERSMENGELGQVVLQVLTNEQREQYKQGLNIDVAYDIPRLGRFRFNFSRSRGQIVIAIRIVPLVVPSFNDLNLPPVLKKIANYRRGLVLVVGTTGSGKSTTLASMVRHISSTQKSHIISIEDPIEYTYPAGTGLITQKELGRDVPDYPSAMRSVLRQDPDVIVIGEMRDRETIDTALLAAETGHFVISTLHTLDAAETIHRILSAYPAQQQTQVRQQLASILRAVVALRLVPRSDKKGVIPAVEVMINNDRIKEMISKPDRIHEINAVLEESFESFGMQTFDQGLMELLSQGAISYDTAISNASRPGLFDLRASGVQSMGGEKKWSKFERKSERSTKEEALALQEKRKARSQHLVDWDDTTPSERSSWSYKTPEYTQTMYARKLARRNSGRRSHEWNLNFLLVSSALGIISGFLLWWMWTTTTRSETHASSRVETAQIYVPKESTSVYKPKMKNRHR